MSANEKRGIFYLIEARAIISALIIVFSFITLIISMLFAPEFFSQVYVFTGITIGWPLGYYFGAKNHEKRQEQLLNYIFALLRGQAPRVVSSTASGANPPR